MPTYAYACRQCDHRFDAVQSFAEPSLTECPECGGALRKEYGSIGVTFNGPGFYRTDSRSGAEGSRGDKNGGDSATTTGGEKKSEPAAKAPGGGDAASPSSKPKTSSPATAGS